MTRGHVSMGAWRRVTASVLTGSLLGTSVLTTPDAALAQGNPEPLDTLIRTVQERHASLQDLVSIFPIPGALVQQAQMYERHYGIQRDIVAAIESAFATRQTFRVPPNAPPGTPPNVQPLEIPHPLGPERGVVFIPLDEGSPFTVEPLDLFLSRHRRDSAQRRAETLANLVSYLRENLPGEQQNIEAAREISRRLAAARQRHDALARGDQALEGQQQEIQRAQAQIQELQGQGQGVAAAGVGGFLRGWAAPVAIGAGVGWWLRGRLAGPNLQNQQIDLANQAQEIARLQEEIRGIRARARCNVAYEQLYTALVLGAGTSRIATGNYLRAVLETARAGQNRPPLPRTAFLDLLGVLRRAVEGDPQEAAIQGRIDNEIVVVRENIGAMTNNFVNECLALEGFPPYDLQGA